MNSTEYIATVGAFLESNFDTLKNLVIHQIYDKKPVIICADGKETPLKLTLIDSQTIPGDGKEKESVKCLAFSDEDGNIYVHFRGTGDGYWRNNTGAYSEAPSDVQRISCEFFDRVMRKYGVNAEGEVYVTGHSQGGNTAQYVTMISQYGYLIDKCVSLDGPGFSKRMIEYMKWLRGEAGYNEQLDKIYGYNGESDYVSALGEEQLIPADRVTLIKTPTIDGEKDNPMFRFHHSKYLLNDDGGVVSLNPHTDKPTPFRELAIAIAKQLAENYPPEEQEKIAHDIMLLAEWMLGDDEGGNIVVRIQPEELQHIKEVLEPFLVELLAERSDLIAPALCELGCSEEMIALVDRILKEFNDLPSRERADIIKILLDVIQLDEDGGIKFNLWNSIPEIPFLASVVYDVVKENPDDAIAVLAGMIPWDSIASFIQEHPMETAKVIGFVVTHFDTLVPVLGELANVVVDFTVSLSRFIERVYKIVETVKNISETIKNFFLQSIQAIHTAFDKAIKTLWSLTPGAQYVQNNPYFKADTAKLRSYAQRLGVVNRRLTQLDRDLNSLYWQVGFLDIHDILMANLITGYSFRVLQCQSFLNTTAKELEEADNTAKRCMGG